MESSWALFLLLVALVSSGLLVCSSNGEGLPLPPVPERSPPSSASGTGPPTTSSPPRTGSTAIPRTIWLDSHGKQLLQWPVEEAEVEIDCELTYIDKADPFDPSWLLDVEKHCREAGASVSGSIGPFGLVVLASDNMEEHTAVHFRVYKSEQKYMILMCSDLRRSSLRPGLYTPAYGGFFEYDLEKEKKISLRTLIDRSAVESFGGGGRVCIMARVYPVAVVDGVAHVCLQQQQYHGQGATAQGLEHEESTGE
ncbi:hypothetical protein ZWY2020_026266 [Hordeum vulgare]|nr:hypothetical protein ZWY2020_026266 [Hordeum vulgare]